MRATAVVAALLIAGIVALLPAWADSLYRRAEREYQAGDFEKARTRCLTALRLRPSHAEARALRMEIDFILGEGRLAIPLDYSVYVTKTWWSGSSLKEMDDALARAEETGDEREWRKILEYAKWLPDGVEVRARTDQARAYLECVSIR